MMRTVYYAVIIILLLAATALSVYFYNRYFSGLSGNELDAIPASAGLYLSTEIREGNCMALTRQPVWKLLQLFFQEQRTSVWQRMDSLLNTKNFIPLKDSRLYISVHPVADNRFDLLFLSGAPLPDRLNSALTVLRLWSSDSLKISKRRYEGVTLYDCSHDHFSFTFCISKNVFIGSSTPFLVEDAIRQQKASARRLYQLRLLSDVFFKNKKKSSESLYLHFESAGGLAQVFLNREFYSLANASFLGSTAELRIEEHSNHLLLTGFTAWEDSAQLAAFISKQRPVKPEALEVLPASVAWFRWLGFENSLILKSFFDSDPLFLKANSEVERQIGIKPAGLLLPYLTGEFITLLLRPASVKYETNRLTIFRLKDAHKTQALIDQWSRKASQSSGKTIIAESYNNHKIKQIRLAAFQQALAGSWANPAPVSYYLLHGNYLVLASSASALRTYINDFQSGQLLIKKSDFSESNGFLRAKTNFLMFYNIPESTYFLKALLNPKFQSILEDNSSIITSWSALAWQMTGSSSSCETRLNLIYAPDQKQPAIELITTERTQNALLTGIFPVFAGRESFALVQDEEGQLYRFSSSGSLEWMNLMPGKIISPFFIADLYRNIRKQVVFNTADMLIALDPDGDFISNFPVSLPAPASGPMIKIPFNKGWQEAFLVPTVNGRIYAYQPNGRIFNRWNFNYPEPVELLTHGNLQNRDYVALYTASGRIMIAADNGNLLWQSNSSVSLAGKNKRLFADTLSGKFVFCTENGTVTRLSPEGMAETNAPVNEIINDFLMEDFDMDGMADWLFLTPKQLVIFSQQGKKLFSYDFKKENSPVQLSAYKEGPYCFVLCHSPEENLTWVFNQKTGHYDRSPVKGGLPGFIADFNTDGKPELVTASAEGFVYFYSLN
jgi:hypothetical protein